MSIVNLKIIFVKTPNSRPGRDIHYNRNGRNQTRISVALKQAPHLRGGVNKYSCKYGTKQCYYGIKHRSQINAAFLEKS